MVDRVSNLLPGIDGVVEERILARLEQAGRHGLDPDELESELVADWSRDQVRQALDRLHEEGHAAEWNRRWFALRFTDWVVGPVQLLSGGSGMARVFNDVMLLFAW